MLLLQQLKLQKALPGIASATWISTRQQISKSRPANHASPYCHTVGHICHQPCSTDAIEPIQLRLLYYMTIPNEIIWAAPGTIRSEARTQSLLLGTSSPSADGRLLDQPQLSCQARQVPRGVTQPHILCSGRVPMHVGHRSSSSVFQNLCPGKYRAQTRHAREKAGHRMGGQRLVVCHISKSHTSHSRLLQPVTSDIPHPSSTARGPSCSPVQHLSVLRISSLSHCRVPQIPTNHSISCCLANMLQKNHVQHVHNNST